MRVFLSHSSANAQQAKDICDIVEQSGYKCFLAPRDIRSGCEYAEEIINGIDNCDVMLLLLSEEANSSPHVLREIERAVSKKIPIMVYKLEQVQLSKSMEYFLMTHQWLNEKSDKGYEEIVLSLNELEGRERPAEKAVQSLGSESKQSALSKKRIILLVAAALCFVGGLLCALLLGGDKQEDTPSGSSAVQSATSEVQQTASTTEQAASSAEQTTTTAQTTTASQTTTTAETTTQSESAPPADAPVVTEQSTTADSATGGEPVEVQPAVGTVEIELGDSITLGRYNGEEIEWRVIALSEDGTKATVISQDILTMKAYDAAEGGKFNCVDGEYYWNVKAVELDAQLQRDLRGDNRWEQSNIRTWLNSYRENVVYGDQAPTAQAMSENKNAYNTEAGFLKGFTDDELSAIAETQVETNGTVTTDRVYLLSSDELELLVEADISIDAKPTDAAVAQDQSAWYSLYSADFGVSDHYWWLRDGAEDNACEVKAVGNSYTGNKVFSDSAGLEGYGVRPVMTIDLTSEYIAGLF